jgi:hypothetical protein
MGGGCRKIAGKQEFWPPLLKLFIFSLPLQETIQRRKFLACGYFGTLGTHVVRFLISRNPHEYWAGTLGTLGTLTSTESFIK